eukprot:TRINITY_DN9778_c0_g2_i2.p1 TRINITY_DN9778_c0_g2~~TRINITY_DN9778_c0_g2_i2.p1  ORF type:complete len:359 (+),score=85.78 TRINITY_DN9778_c0_g2_i2:88-1164(+)
MSKPASKRGHERTPSGWSNPFAPSSRSDATFDADFSVLESATKNGNGRMKRDSVIEIDLEACVPDFVAAYPYAAKEVDELELKKGDLIFVTEQGEDGWYVGVNLTTSAAGTFPGNFVIPITSEPDGDAELARKLQEEEDAAIAASSSTTSSAVDQDAIFARMLQEEEDRKLAMQAQASSGSAASAAAGSARPESAASLGSNASEGFAPFHARDYEQFTVKFLGSLEIKKENIQAHTVSAIRAMQRARKQQKVSSIKVFHLQISAMGVKLVELHQIKKKSFRKKKQPLPAGPPPTRYFPISNVAHCAFDPDQHKMFAFVSQSPSGKQYAVHVFEFDQSASQIANAFRRAFNDSAAKRRQ